MKVQLKVIISVNIRGKVTNPILTTRWPKRSSTRRPTGGGDILTLKGVFNTINNTLFRKGKTGKKISCTLFILKGIKPKASHC